VCKSTPATLRNDLVFDIGANNGDDAAAFLNAGYRVVSVEGNPDLCVDLRRRFASEIAAGHLFLIDKAISRQRNVTFFVNSEESGWGTTVPSYAARGLRMRGEIREIEVETTTIIDLIRAYGVPAYMKVDIEGADILCLLDLYGGDIPEHLSIERPKSLPDQFFALNLLRRMGYTQFAYVDQTEGYQPSALNGQRNHLDNNRSIGLLGGEISSSAWMGWRSAWAKNALLYGVWALGGVARRTPGLKAVAPRVHWYDVHACRAPQSQGAT
jgi:FkbM family methyltransferase